MTLMQDVARFAVQYQTAPVPGPILEHAKKAFANWLGVTMHGSRTVEGRRLTQGAHRLGGLSRDARAFLLGAFGHIDDFDDTHLDTVAHASTPVFAALASYSDGVSARDWLRAAAVGTEVVIRMALLLNPDHYDAGWHVTASVGGIGAAIAVGMIQGLDTEAMTYAGALAALQPVGLRAAFGTTGKSFQVGRAAAAGVASFAMAASGADAPPDILEHRRGLRITTTSFHPEAVAGLGEQWEFLKDAFKPYACGIVTHPVIDAGRGIYLQGVNPASIRKITARVHPLVPELTGIRQPKTGLAVKFSANTLLAWALSTGDVPLVAFEAPLPEAVVELAERVDLQGDPGMPRDSAEVRVTVEAEETAACHVQHARGSRDNPMTWDDLSHKFAACTPPGVDAVALWDAVLGAERLRMEDIWRLVGDGIDFGEDEP